MAPSNKQKGKNIMTDIQIFEKALNFAREMRPYYDDRSIQTILECGFSRCAKGHVWKVIGITKDALEQLKENDFDYHKVKPVRSHLHQRKQTAMTVIDSNMNAQEAFDFMYERDVAYLSLRSENKDDGSLKAYVEIDHNLGYFKSTTCGYRFHKKHEVPFLKEICEKM